MSRRIAVTVAFALTTAAMADATAQAGMGGRGMGMGMGMGMDSATAAQMGVVHELMMNHDRIKRTVTNLPNGIRTVTESGDARLAALVRKHTLEMTARVASGSDPGLPMESPALRTIFRNKELIRTRTDITPTGIAVEQTSADSLTVVALQKHAAEVTELVREGMAAMHRAMTQTDTVPGASVMAEKRTVIPYTFRALPRGGELRITSKDPQAIAAIHEFLAFQRKEHRAS